jgi:UDP-N-acetylmuramyl pentapeptide phosphotransferase/UDP-N-acetylglucosamine-1-phosphate transferase
MLILLLLPLLRRRMAVQPNSRSSHKAPTPQGGGIAVIGATIMVVVGLSIFYPDILKDPLRLAVVFMSTAGLAVLGATDDIHPLEALPRLLLQAAAVAVVIAVMPAEMRIVPVLPWWFERACLLVGILWFVNLVNFMDGIDWMTVAEVVPLTIGLTLIGLIGALPRDATVVAIALCGAIIGFAPFNRPVARLFLGDVGSLPIGLLLSWLLVSLAGNGHFYYIADSTITLLRRLAAGEAVMQAHRSHFYQRAMDGGFTVHQIVGRVFAVNIALALLALGSLAFAQRILHLGALAAGCAIVAWLLWSFARGRR